MARERGEPWLHDDASNRWPDHMAAAHAYTFLQGLTMSNEDLYLEASGNDINDLENRLVSTTVLMTATNIYISEHRCTTHPTSNARFLRISSLLILGYVHLVNDISTIIILSSSSTRSHRGSWHESRRGLRDRLSSLVALFLRIYDLPMRRQYIDGCTRSRTCLFDPGCQSFSSSGTDSRIETPLTSSSFSSPGIRERDS